MPFGADDIATPELLDELVALAWSADVVYPSMLLVDETATTPFNLYPAQPFCGHRLRRWNFVTGSSLIRRSKILEVGGFRTMETLEDWDLMVRMHAAGARFKPCPEKWFLYRQVEGSRNRVQIGDGTRAEYHQMRRDWQQRIIGDLDQLKATFYHQATTGTTYWRCQLPARYLPGQAMPVTATIADVDPDTGHFDFYENAGTAVWQFPGSQDSQVAILNMKAAGIRVLIESDDNYFDLSDPLTRSRAGWGLHIEDAPHSVEGHRYIVESADGVIVTTPSLAEVYRRVNPNVYLCPNQIDPADYPEEWEKPDDGVFRIGWFASASHDRDEHLVRRALSWASRQPDVEIVTMGVNPFMWNFARRHIEWSPDLDVYRKAMYELDVGVCPVERSGWSVCRSDAKALEYAAAGALPIMSSLPSYESWRGKAGLHAATAKDFEDQIRWCVKHRDAAREKAREAREYVMTERTVPANIHRWEEAVAA